MGRCRHAKGPCGGFTAYTFRHPERADLIAAVQAWAAAKNARKTKIAAHRLEELEAFRGVGSLQAGGKASAL